MFVVVVVSGGTICGAFGPFASREAANAYAAPRTETQRGEIRGIVTRLGQVLADPRDSGAPHTIAVTDLVEFERAVGDLVDAKAWHALEHMIASRRERSRG